MFECEECHIKFKRSDTYQRHNHLNHSEKPHGIVSCHLCSFSTKHKYNLISHFKTHTGSQPKVRCCLCNLFTCSFRRPMIRHYKLVHQIEINEREYYFDSENEFKLWKEEIESSECCQFIASTGIKTIGETLVRYLNCSKDGYYSIRGPGRKRLKRKDSLKVSCVCPASMKTTKDSSTGAMTVSYIDSHVGHSRSEQCPLELSTEERESITEKISAEVPVRDILDLIYRSSSRCGVRRLHDITAIRDVRAPRLLQERIMQHSDDRGSLKSWLASLGNCADVVRLYKPQFSVISSHPELKEEDFVLILSFNSQLEMLSLYGDDCISFHGVNGYSFQLTTLLVKDHLREGVPCAYMISNREDSEIMELFIREVVGLLAEPPTPQVLLSDKSEIYINAWKKVMPEQSVLWLFCGWNVDQAWRENLNKIPNLVKICEVYKMLRVLADEEDETVFLLLFDKAKKLLRADPELSQFAKYFSSEYGNCATSWALCYRTYRGIETNFLPESIHMVLECYFLDDIEAKRLDKGLTALLQSTKERMIDRVLERSKKLKTHLTAIREVHDLSSSLSCVIIPTETGWMIYSESKHEMYTITRQNVICDCTLRCNWCNICEHDYRCTCMDSLKSHMCIHIHRIANIYGKDGTLDFTRENCVEDPLKFKGIDDPSQQTVLKESSAANYVFSGDECKRYEDMKREVVNSFISMVEGATSCAKLTTIKNALLPVPQALRAVKSELTAAPDDENVNIVPKPKPKLKCY